MIRIINKISYYSYKKIIKPILFKQSPDTVHQRLLKAGGVIQRIKPLRGLLHIAWSYQNNSMLSQSVCNIQFSNPVGLSAGFDKNIELPLLMKAVGFGFMEGGSLTFHQCAGNPRPWFHRLPKTRSLVVHAGLNNDGVTKIIKRIKNYPPNSFDNFPLNISVAKTNSHHAATNKEAIEDYIGSLKKLQKAKIGNLITLNISCPNTYGGEPFTTPAKLGELLTRVDELSLKQPIFIKMPINLPWLEFDALIKTSLNHNIAGLTIGNLAKDRKKVDLKDPLPEDVAGNLSGKPTWHLSNDLIRRTYKKYGNKLVIIGVGGIFSAEDAYTKIRLGASLVELITGVVFEGPSIVGQINLGLVDLLKRDGYEHISEVIGIDA